MSASAETTELKFNRRPTGGDLFSFHLVSPNEKSLGWERAVKGLLDYND
jgi:hypothetical protein